MANKYGKQKGVTHMACWAHARREFERALDNDKARAEKALLLIQKLYAVERKAREEGYSLEQVKNLRLEMALPVINELGEWISKEMKTVLPKSQIGKAFAYAQNRWDQLSVYLKDGNLQIDNNQIRSEERRVGKEGRSQIVRPC